MHRLHVLEGYGAGLAPGEGMLYNYKDGIGFSPGKLRVATDSGKQGKQGKSWKKKFPEWKNQGIW